MCQPPVFLAVFVSNGIVSTGNQLKTFSFNRAITSTRRFSQAAREDGLVRDTCGANSSWILKLRASRGIFVRQAKSSAVSFGGLFVSSGNAVGSSLSQRGIH